MALTLAAPHSTAKESREINSPQTPVTAEQESSLGPALRCDACGTLEPSKIISCGNEREWKRAEAHKAAAPENNPATEGQAGKKLPQERVAVSLPVLGFPAAVGRGPARRAAPLEGGSKPTSSESRGHWEQQGPSSVAVAELVDEELVSRDADRSSFSSLSEQTSGRARSRRGQRQAGFISLRIKRFCLSAIL